MGATRICGVLTLVTLGGVLLAAGLVFPRYFPGIMSAQLDAKLLIHPDSPTLGNFVAPPVPIFMQYYFFNVTNPDAVLMGEKPVLFEMGPYTFEETRLKYGLDWDAENHTVTYRQNKTFFFRPDLSNGYLESDLVTTVNPIYLVLADKLSAKDDVSATLVFGLLSQRFGLSPYMTRQARELLFEGYLEETIKEFLYPLSKDPAHLSERFGFFLNKNGSNDGTYEVSTGGAGLDSLQLIHEWKGEKTLSYWKNDTCNMINGTEGSQFPRPINKERKMYMFSSDLCRSLYLKFEKTVEHGGLTLNRYVLPREVLAKGPENDCYCVDEFTCRDSMVNLSPCKKGAPIITSTPHFYMGAEEDISALDGLRPVKEEHETFLDIEPRTGVTFQAHKRIQISMPWRRFSVAAELQNVTELIHPILWLNESAVVPVERAEALHAKLTVPVLVVGYTCWALIAVGALLILVAVALVVKEVIAHGNGDQEKAFEEGEDKPLQEKKEMTTLSPKSLKEKEVNAAADGEPEAYKHLFTKETAT